MTKIMLKAAFLAAAATLLSTSAHAAYTLTNTNGGDGFVNTSANGFDLFSANNSVGSTITKYSNTASSTGTSIFYYKYSTNDVDGAAYDPAGYFINNNLFQLSPATSAYGYTQSGVVSLGLSAGDIYGFYAAATDSQLGRGDIAVTAVPEPATWALMLVGMGAIGFAMRRRATVAVSYA